MGARKLDDAIDLAAWYEQQPHQSTTLSDNEIALELRWTRGGPQHHGRSRTQKSASTPYGDAARVREARRFVDHDKTGLFEDFFFGSRENGGGRSVSRLHRRSDEYDGTALQGHAREQVLRTLQLVRQHESERELRILPTLREITEALQNGKAPVQVILAMHDVVRDMEQYGRIMPNTQWALIKAGIKL